jgi:transcriptional regulator GlxA family with amidase domain
MAVPLRYGVTDTRIARAIESMESSIEQPLSLIELAQLAKSSPRQLQRLFLDALGRSPGQIYTEIRLRAGRHLLQQSTLAVAEVALRCGFADASHFTRRYRDHFGETPAETRRALRRPLPLA